MTTVSIQLPAGTMAVPAARRFVSDTLLDWGVADRVRENAELVVSELVGNAVEHGGGTTELVVSRTDDVVRVDVVDQNPELPTMLRPDPAEDRHRGMLIVAALSSTWGTDRIAGGKTVWARLPCGVTESIEVEVADVGPEISRDRLRPVARPTSRPMAHGRRAPAG